MFQTTRDEFNRDIRQAYINAANSQDHDEIITMPNLYVNTPNGYYFIIEPSVTIDQNKFKSNGGLIHDNINDMYATVMNKFGLAFDEVDGSEYTIATDYKGDIVSIDNRGFMSELENDVTDFLLNFEL